MALFFNGRQWISPAVMTQIDDSRMYGRPPSNGNNLAIIGRANGGKPLMPLRFSTPSEAKAVLRGGDLLKALSAAFNASTQSTGPAYITVVRLDPAVQASLTVDDSFGAGSLLLKSTNYGVLDNAIYVKIEDGAKGLKLTTLSNDVMYTKEDAYLDIMGIEYSGSETTATVTINNASMVITIGSTAHSFSFDLYDTVSSLASAISNSSIGIVVSVASSTISERKTKNMFDCVTSQSIKGAEFNVTANLQAAVEWFNSISEGFVTANRVISGVQTFMPVPTVDDEGDASFNALTGGDDGTTTTEDWASAFDVLYGEDVQWIVPLTSEEYVFAMTDAHCSYMSNIGRKERRAIVGTALGTTDAEAILTAKTINSDRVSLVHIGIYDYDTVGRLVLFEPYFAAAMIAGAFCGINPGTPMTNKSIKISGLERSLRNPTDTDFLVKGGVMCLEDTPTGYRVVQSISTWLTNDNYNRREVSVGVACDFMMRKVRAVAENFRGNKNNPQALTNITEQIRVALNDLARPEPGGPGVLAGDTENPPFKDLLVTQQSDVMRIEFTASPVLPINYIPIVCHAVPYPTST